MLFKYCSYLNIADCRGRGRGNKWLRIKQWSVKKITEWHEANYNKANVPSSGSLIYFSFYILDGNLVSAQNYNLYGISHHSNTIIKINWMDLDL